MGIIIESAEFDPSLRERIAAFIDAFFEDQDVGEDIVVEELMPMMAAAAEPSESSRSAQEPSTGVFGKVRESFDGFRGREATAQSTAAPRREAAAPQRSVVPRDGNADFMDVMSCGSTGDLKLWLDQVDEPFSTTLLALIDRKGLTDVDVYKRAHMSRQLFSRIRSDASYRPAKKTVLALAIAMELSLDEMRDLLVRAGFALSRSNKRDLIVEYFVTNGVFDLFTINEALYEFDQPLI